MDIISLVYTYPHTERCLHIGTPVHRFAWDGRRDRRLAKREHLVALIHSRIIPFAEASQSLAEVELDSVLVAHIIHAVWLSRSEVHEGYGTSIEPAPRNISDQWS